MTSTNTQLEYIDLEERKGRTMVASFATETETETETEDWQALARCASEMATNDVFFSEELQDIAQAKAICADCPVIAPCLEGAIERREPWGVWGGQLFMNGKVLMIKRRRGRPPKNPRPEDQMPVVPVPEHLQGLLRTA